MSDSTNSQDSSSDGHLLPQHIAVIMDGNGRWARKRGLPRVAGHRKGVEAVRLLIQTCGHKNIPRLTVFAFSSENWQRPEQEVNRLMELFIQALDKDVKELHKNNIRFQVIGNISALSRSVQKRIHNSELMTKDNTGMVFTVAMNYGGRWDISEACKLIAKKVSDQVLEVDSISIDTIAEHLSTSGSPDPDLFIRTGGEKRISNFMLWQLAYTELFFTELLWPEFDEAAFNEALEVYSKRQRRFGQTSEQVEAV